MQLYCGFCLSIPVLCFSTCTQPNKTHSNFSLYLTLSFLFTFFYTILNYHCQRRWGSCSVRSSSSWERWVGLERSPWRWTTGVPCCFQCGLEGTPSSLDLHYQCTGLWTCSGKSRSLVSWWMTNKELWILWKLNSSCTKYQEPPPFEI